MTSLHPLHSASFPCHVVNHLTPQKPNDFEYLIQFSDGKQAIYPAVRLLGLEGLPTKAEAAASATPNYCRENLLPAQVLLGSLNQQKYATAVNLSGIGFFRGINGTGMEEKTLHLVKLEEWDSTIFELVLGLCVDKKFLTDLVAEDSISNPDFYESLVDALSFFCPGDSVEILEWIKEELNFIKPSQALCIKEAYDAAISKSQGEVKEEDKPYLVKVAERILKTPSCFKDEKEKAEFFGQLIQTNHDCLRFKRKLKRKEDALAGLPADHNQLLKAEISFCNDQIKALEDLLKQLTNQIDLEKMPLLRHQYLANNMKVSEKGAEISLKKINEYRENILQKCNENGVKDRPDLLSYIVGPNNYICDYYDCKLPEEDVGEDSIIFNYGTRPIIIKFNEVGPWELEESIRSQINFFYKSKVLPPRIILEKTITRTFTEEEKKQHGFFIDCFKRWNTLSPEELIKIKSEVLSLMEQGIIEPADLVELVPPSENDYILKGTLSKGRFKCPFTFNPYTKSLKFGKYDLEIMERVFTFMAHQNWRISKEELDVQLEQADMDD